MTAPASLLVAHDVEEGRDHLNFSEWNARTPSWQSHHAEEIVEEIEGYEAILARDYPVILTLNLFAAALAVPALADHHKEDGFVKLFDGKSLEGWKISTENRPFSSVESRTRSFSRPRTSKRRSTDAAGRPSG